MTSSRSVAKIEQKGIRLMTDFDYTFFATIMDGYNKASADLGLALFMCFVAEDSS